MAKEAQTQAGRCSTHGTVEATREIPETGFPYVVYAIRRARRPAPPVPLPGMRSSRPGRRPGRGLRGVETAGCDFVPRTWPALCASRGRFRTGSRRQGITSHR